ncbi:dUTP diphosphatase [Paenibacillus apii]|uniref:dUTP diphosphatase n=1 Tax=Paenibacillus apii TaxID=1850370 RepID=UPI002E29E33C|nr:deoxyuridine 5'-triphosphate nucleotidohydrolase [Paenibacillus apii]
MPVKISLLPGAELPKYAKPGDSGFDLVAQEDYVVEPGETIKVRTGIRIELPEGLEVQIRPRSGVSANTKLRVANSPGTGDSSYRGEICVLIDNIAQAFRYDSIRFYGVDGYLTSDKRVVPGADNTYIIRKGDRIAQAVIAPVYRAAFEVVTELTETERGDGAFGHTGVSAE